MCRLAAYLGPTVSLRQFLFEPEHSLYRQSWQPRELTYASLNADGYGFGWLLDDGRPAVYRSPAPIWADGNLESLAQTMHRDFWFAMVRSATPGYTNNEHNTQPFHDQRHLFMHNGYIKDFRQTMRRALLEELDADVEGAVRGLTDSEYLFALLRQTLRRHPAQPVADAIRRTLEWVAKRIGPNHAMLNLLVGDGQAVYAARCAFNERAPSLYHFADGETRIVASESMTAAEAWHAVPEGSLLSIVRGCEPKIAPL